MLKMEPLRHRPFRRLWLGLGMFHLGFKIMHVALPWYVLQFTGSGVSTGFIFLCLLLPGIVTGPLLGLLLDRFQPRVIIMLDNLMLALCMGSIPLLAALGCLHLWYIYLIAFLFGALTPATETGMRILLPHLVAEAELENAYSWLQMNVPLAALVGPLLGVSALAGPGSSWVLIPGILSFLMMALLSWLLPSLKRQPVPLKQILYKYWLGFGPLMRLKEARWLTFFTLGLYFLFGPFELALPFYCDKELHTGATGYAFLLISMGIGTLFALPFTDYLLTRMKPGTIQMLVAISWGTFTALLLPMISQPIAIALLILAGAGWAPFKPVQTAFLQRLIPAELQGQVFGTYWALAAAAKPLGAVASSFLLGPLSSSWLLTISGLGCVLFGIGGLLSPTVRRMQRQVLETQSAPGAAISAPSYGTLHRALPSASHKPEK
ncbi:MFS transporter [Thermosporothrix hazakensis]|jgi:MFS family permease|nr:MFS transporter [Thermosporothrix hazakensis]